MEVVLSRAYAVNCFIASSLIFVCLVAMLSIAQHPNVVHLYGANANPHTRKPFIVMELCVLGSIEDVVERVKVTAGRCALTEPMAVVIIVFVESNTSC